MGFLREKKLPHTPTEIEDVTFSEAITRLLNSGDIQISVNFRNSEKCELSKIKGFWISWILKASRESESNEVLKIWGILDFQKSSKIRRFRIRWSSEVHETSEFWRDSELCEFLRILNTLNSEGIWRFRIQWSSEIHKILNLWSLLNSGKIQNPAVSEYS